MELNSMTGPALYKSLRLYCVFFAASFAVAQAIDFSGTTTPCIQSGEGYIRGRVQSSDGSPIAGAKAMAFRTDQKGVLQSTVTDDRGEFTFNVPFGDYIVWSSKETDGYPDCNLAVFKCNSPHVHVGPQPSQVVVQARKAARIRGHITDRSNGNELKGVSILIRRADDYYLTLSQTVDSSFSLIVPSDTDLVVTTSLAKFRLWDFRDPATYFATLTLRPGEEAVLNIQMDRLEP